MNYDLYIFDVDGTLAERDSTDLLPGVAEWFATNRAAVVLATNQGGVGLRCWMEAKGFGNPERYPTEDEVRDRLARLAYKLGIPLENVLKSFGYQSKRSGEYWPSSGNGELPCFVTDIEGELLPWWSEQWRKPAPGMLLEAIERYGTRNALMIGDSEEDRLAAKAAGIDFVWADEFFGRATS